MAPVSKKLGLIEQWSNGLQLITDELKKYPEILLTWQEPGIAFRVTFTNTNFQKKHELQHELQHELLQELKQESVNSKVS